jgi:hypothetical protein
MTISSYKVDSVIKAYNKQTQTPFKNHIQNGIRINKFHSDSVAISCAPVDKSATFEKISYNICDLILKSAGC